MTLWGFLTSHSDVPLPRVMLFAGISGLSNALLLAVVNSAAHTVSNHGWDTQLFLLFLIALVLYILTQRYILRISTVQVEKIVAKLRVRMTDKIRRADLQAIEGLGRAQLYASLNTDTLTMSQATAPMMIACQGAILVVFSLGYIYLLSPGAFILTLVIVALGVSIHFKNRKLLASEFEQSTAKENELFDTLTHLLDGFKEVKLNSARSRDLFAHLKEITRQVAELKTRTGVRYADYYLFTQVIFFMLLAAMVFVLPSVSPVYGEQVSRITAAILFIIGPLTMVVGALPVFQNATHAINKMARLDAELDRAQEQARDRDNGDVVVPPPFEEIRVDRLGFSYHDREGKPLFTVGPLSLTVTRGEILFLVGGNGSGKSTVFKLLTGLYYPDAGTIAVDGLDITSVGHRRYREMFSGIFTDYHLFVRLYGLANIEDRQVYDLLRLMQLEHKTSWHDGHFENQELSTGQKKRLALIVSLLEDKPIYVFDEWAADQDPEFRKFFYDTLLPELKSRGKTVIAATHDDRYFYACDRVLKMEMGQIVSTERGGTR